MDYGAAPFGASFIGALITLQIFRYLCRFDAPRLNILGVVRWRADSMESRLPSSTWSGRYLLYQLGFWHSSQLVGQSRTYQKDRRTSRIVQPLPAVLFR